MSLEIILRTCDRANVHIDWRTRYCDFSKSALIQGCFVSLVASSRNINNVKITVLDDHSSQSTINFIKDILITNGIDHEFISLPEYGYNYSALKQFERCRDSEYKLVYAVEDDYLHVPTAIQEMLDSYYLFYDRVKRPIVLYPFDNPEEYNPPKLSSFVVHGSNRHWRTGEFTTQVMLSSPVLFKQHWPLFETLATKYNGDYLNPRTEHFEESNTIWKIWNEGHAIRFNPIPSLALHMQFIEQLDPFINWRQWWNDYAQNTIQYSKD